MMRFGVLFLLFFFYSVPVFSKQKSEQPISEKNDLIKKDKNFNKTGSIKYSKKEIFDIDSQIKRTEADKELDVLIKTTLGEGFRRANVNDLFPLELPKSLAKQLNQKDQIAMIEYYNYSRNDLEKISGGKLLKSYKFNFDVDKSGLKDHALVVFNEDDKKNYLAIINPTQTLYLEELKATYLEPVNSGLFPTQVIYEGDKRKTVNSPALRMVSFDDRSYIFYFDTKEKIWQELFLD